MHADHSAHSALCPDVLDIVQSYLRIPDYRVFRATCRHWRDVSVKYMLSRNYNPVVTFKILERFGTPAINWRDKNIISDRWVGRLHNRAIRIARDPHLVIPEDIEGVMCISYKMLCKYHLENLSEVSMLYTGVMYY